LAASPVSCVFSHISHPFVEATAEPLPASLRSPSRPGIRLAR
jgi:hypothetical protein